MSAIPNPAILARMMAARHNARRFAEALSDEQDEAMKAYLRSLALSWNRIAEQQEFLADLSGEQDRA